MKRIHIARMVVLIVTISFLSAASAQQTGKKEFTFQGKVEKVDVKAKTITVKGEKVAGWMDAMTMTYSLDKDDVLQTIKVGDQITAKVHEGDFKVLHAVQVAAAKETAPPAAK